MKKYLLFLYIITSISCNNDDGTSIDDFFTNHANKVWIDEGTIINENFYTLKKFLMSDGQDGSPFTIDYYFEAGLGECSTSLIGENIEENNSEEDYYCTKRIVEILQNEKNILRTKTSFYTNCDDEEESFYSLLTYTVNNDEMEVSGSYSYSNSGDRVFTKKLYAGTNLPDCF